MVESSFLRASEQGHMPGMVNRAFRMMAGTFASRVLGLLREVLTAGFFGATRSLDAFYVAYTLANLSRDDRSEERRVGKECRSRWSPYH